MGITPNISSESSEKNYIERGNLPWGDGASKGDDLDEGGIDKLS